MSASQSKKADGWCHRCVANYEVLPGQQRSDWHADGIDITQGLRPTRGGFQTYCFKFIRSGECEAGDRCYRQHGEDDPRIRE